MAPHKLAQGQEELATKLGELIAWLECDLLTGGGGGAMEDERPGRAIGIIPGRVSIQSDRYERKANYRTSTWRYRFTPTLTRVARTAFSFKAGIT